MNHDVADRPFSPNLFGGTAYGVSHRLTHRLVIAATRARDRVEGRFNGGCDDFIEGHPLPVVRRGAVGNNAGNGDNAALVI
jgi:hypothetical protein